MDLRDHFTVLVAEKSDGVGLAYTVYKCRRGPPCLNKKGGKDFPDGKTTKCSDIFIAFALI